MVARTHTIVPESGNVAAGRTGQAILLAQWPQGGSMNPPCNPLARWIARRIARRIARSARRIARGIARRIARRIVRAVALSAIASCTVALSATAPCHCARRIDED